MENASKALIMAAEILIGVMILSILVYLFNVFARYSEETYTEIEKSQISEFNNRFLKFYGTRKNDEGKDVPIECTIHDIVSLANFVQKYNLDNGLIEENISGNNAYKIVDGITTTNSLYTQIVLDGEKLELKSNDYLVDLIKQNDLKLDDSGKETQTKYYKCTKCESKNSDKRINYVEFKEIN